ncbi:MAG: monofunctional biosynthetic peptidoglycan transglycosylase [Rhizobiales bacterium]|nr:monofunctional biosynthetic peptidoglycan transglycosylase [Hyphomicrobiales bacterium]
MDLARAFSRRMKGGRMRRFFTAIIIACGALFISLAVLIGIFSYANPPVTALMAWRIPSGNGIHHHPVPAAEIAPALVHAVLTSEDNHYCSHRGIDWQAVERAIDEADEQGSSPRGASTITMQTAKNLFLWPQRSYVRKALEAPIALGLDFLWGKRRTIEVYLNIVEWGPGIYGAEAAAQYHFGRTAAELTPYQAALLAAALPAPLVRTAGRPGPVTRRTAQRIMMRMAQTNGLFDCVNGEP